MNNYLIFIEKGNIFILEEFKGKNEIKIFLDINYKNKKALVFKLGKCIIDTKKRKIKND